jgi:hypothetical protein
MKSLDLKKWEDVSVKLSFPKDFRHGTALKISAAVAEKLIKFGVENGR